MFYKQNITKKIKKLKTLIQLRISECPHQAKMQFCTEVCIKSVLVNEMISKAAWKTFWLVALAK